jgi:hypothetical protein
MIVSTSKPTSSILGFFIMYLPFSVRLLKMNRYKRGLELLHSISLLGLPPFPNEQII